MRQCMDSDNLHRRLKKIIGQVQAIDRMIDEDIPCEEILSQINAAKSALNGCGKVVLEGHIKHCVRDGIEHNIQSQSIQGWLFCVQKRALLFGSFYNCFLTTYTPIGIMQIC